MAAEPAKPSLPARVKTRFLRWSGRLLSASRWMAGGAFGTLAVLSAIYPKSDLIPVPLIPFFALAIAGVVVSPVTWLLGLGMRVLPFRDAQVAASPAGLDITRGVRAQHVPASSITQAVVVPLKRGAEVRIALANRDQLVVRVPSIAAGDMLVAGLALDPHQRRTDVTWNPLLRRLLAGLLVLVSTVATLATLGVQVDGTPMSVPVSFLVVSVPFLLASMSARAMRHHVSVGRDGVQVRDKLRKQEIGFADVASVSLFEDRVLHLTRYDGTPMVVDLRQLDPAVAKQLTERMAQSLERFRTLVGSRADVFTRGERDFETWKQDVRRLLEQAVGFRGPALRSEDALRVVEDPHANPEARVGAALALMAVGGEAEKLRVRVAADTTLAPRVRVALEAASSGDVDEDVIAAAMRERAV